MRAPLRSASLCLLIAGCAQGGGEPSRARAGSRGLQPLEELMPSAEARSREVDLEPRADLIEPSRVDLRAHQSPVRDQHQRGACVVFAASALLEHFLNVEDDVAGASGHDLSEQHLFYLTQKSQVANGYFAEGASSVYVFDELFGPGVFDDSFWRYDAQSWADLGVHGCAPGTRDYTCFTNGEPPESASAAPRVRYVQDSPNGGYLFPSASNVRQWLAQHESPVFIAVDWHSAFESDDGVLTLPSDRAPRDGGGHAILAIGYDDDMTRARTHRATDESFALSVGDEQDTGFLIIKNSWGDDWGDGGYGYISYRYFDQYGIQTQAFGPGRVERL